MKSGQSPWHPQEALVKRKRPGISSWLLCFVFLTAAVTLWPILWVVTAFKDLDKTKDHWVHISQFLLPQVLLDTFLLVGGVAGLSSVLGVSLAWILSQYHFPGRAFFEKALILPLGIPVYITAFVYVGLFDYTGPVGATLRKSIGLDFSSGIQTLGGAIFVLSLGLYPYVYLMCLEGFQSQGQRFALAAQTLGAGPGRIFWRVLLPYSRPFVFGGLILVILEVLSDFGTVSILGVQTLSTMIYKMWFGFFSPEGAAQLASLLIVISIFLYILNHRLKGQRSYSHLQGGRLKANYKHKLVKKTAMSRVEWTCLGFCSLIFFLGFVVPAGQLLMWCYGLKTRLFDELLKLIPACLNTFYLGFLVALITTIFAFFLNWASRLSLSSRSPKERAMVAWSEHFSLLGYAIPGTVLAVCIYLPLMALDTSLSAIWSWLSGKDHGLLIGGTMFAMILGLSIRMMAVAHSALSSGMNRISQKLDDASKTLGVIGIRQVFAIYIPLLKKAWTYGFILVFVDTVKEMPLTLMTRPLGQEFLSIKIFGLVSEGEWQKAAPSALCLTLVTLLPFFWYKSEDQEVQK